MQSEEGTKTVHKSPDHREMKKVNGTVYGVSQSTSTDLQNIVGVGGQDVTTPSNGSHLTGITRVLSGRVENGDVTTVGALM